MMKVILRSQKRHLNKRHNMRKQLENHLQTLKAKGSITDENIATVLAHWDSEKSNNLSDEDCLASVIKRFFKPKSQEAKANTIDYKGVLFASLSDGKKSSLSKDAVTKIMQAYGEIEQKSGSVVAFESCLSNWGNQLPSQALEAYASANAGTLHYLPTSPVSREIASDLARINSENSVNTNGKSRIAKIIRDYRVALSKFSNVTLNSPFTRGAIDILSPEEIAEVRGHWASKDKKDITAMTSFATSYKSNPLTELQFE